MKRRDLIRGAASASMIAFGSAATAGQTTQGPSASKPYLAIRQDDGTYDVVPRGGGVGTEERISECPEPECEAHCCYDCQCDCCECYYCDDA